MEISKSDEFRDDLWLLLDQAFSSLYTSHEEAQKENIIQNIESIIVNVGEWDFFTNLNSTNFFVWLVENFSYILLEKRLFEFHSRITSACVSLVSALANKTVLFNTVVKTLLQIMQQITGNFNNINSGECSKISVLMDSTIPYGLKNNHSTIPLTHISTFSSLFNCYYEVFSQNHELIAYNASIFITEIIGSFVQLLHLVQTDSKQNIVKVIILFASKTFPQLSIQDWKVICSNFNSFESDSGLFNAFLLLLENFQCQKDCSKIHLLLLQSILNFINNICVSRLEYTADVIKLIPLCKSYIEIIPVNDLDQVNVMSLLPLASSNQELFEILDTYLVKAVERSLPFGNKSSSEKLIWTLSEINVFWAEIIDALNENVETYLTKDDNLIQYLENIISIFSIAGNIKSLESKYNCRFIIYNLLTEHIFNIFLPQKMDNLSHEDELICLVKISIYCVQVLEEWDSISLNNILILYEFLLSPWNGRYKDIFWDGLKPLCYDGLASLLHSIMNIKELNDFALGLVEILFDVALFDEDLLDRCFLFLVIGLLHDKMGKEFHFSTYLKTFFIKDRVDIVINSSLARNILPCFLSSKCILLRGRSGLEINCVCCDLENKSKFRPRKINLEQYLSFVGLSFMKALIQNETDCTLKYELLGSLERFVFHIPDFKSKDCLESLPQFITSMSLANSKYTINSLLKCFLFDCDGKFFLRNAEIVVQSLLPLFSEDNTNIYLPDLLDFLIDVTSLSKTFMLTTIKVLIYVIFNCPLVDVDIDILIQSFKNLLSSHHLHGMDVLIMYEEELSELWIDTIISNIQNELLNPEETLSRIAGVFGMDAKSFLQFRFTPYMIAYLFKICTNEETNFILRYISEILLIPVKRIMVECFFIVYPLVYFMDDETRVTDASNYIEVISQKRLDAIIYFSFKDLVCYIILHLHKPLKVIRFLSLHVFKEESVSKSWNEMLFSYTVGFLTFVDANLSSSSSSIVMIKSCLRSIPNLIKILGIEYLDKIRIKLLATLRTGLPRHYEDHSQECLEAWAYFLYSVNLSFLGSYLTTVVTLLMPLFDMYPQDISKILYYLVVKNGHLYQDYLPELFFIPKSSNLLMKKVHIKIKKVAKSVDVIDGLANTLERIKNGAVESRIHSLEYLFYMLKLRRHELLCIVTQSDKLPIMLHELIDILMMNVHYGNSEIRTICTSCLGEIGAINPARFSYGFRDVQVKKYIDVQSEDFAFLIIMELTKSLQKCDDSRSYNTIANCIQELLKIYFPPQESEKVNSFFCKFSENERNILSSLLETKYVFRNKDLSVMKKKFGFGPKAGQSIFDWATSWAYELVTLMPKNSFVRNVFEKCLPGILTDSETMESLLPHILLQAILSCSKENAGSIASEMKCILQYQRKNVLLPPDTFDLFENDLVEPEEVELGNFNVTDDKGVAIILDLIDFLFKYFSHLKISKNNDHHLIVISEFLKKFPANFISLKSYSLKDYCRALFYLERSYANSSSVLNLAPLRNIYAKLNDADGLLGLVRTSKSIPSMEESILNNVVCGNIQEALSAYEILATKNNYSTGYSRALIQCYLSTNSSSAAMRLSDSIISDGQCEISFSSEVIETACRNLMFDNVRMNIDLIPDDMKRDWTWSIDISHAYLKFATLKFDDMKSLIKLIRHAIGVRIAAISNTTIGAYRQGYSHIVNLHILNDLEMFSKIVVAIYEPNSQIKIPALFGKIDLQSRLRLLPSNGYFLEKVLTSRLQMLSIINKLSDIPSDVKPLIHTQLGIAYLESAKLARKTANLNLSSTYLALAEQYQPIGLFIEKAKLLEAKQETDTAICVLKQGIVQTAQLTNESRCALLRKLSAHAKLLIARYNEENMNVDYTEGTKSYQDAIDTFPTEKNYVYLGKYLYQIHCAELSPDRSAKKCEIQVQAIKNFGNSLLHGCKYIYQSMFCMISLWLDFGARYLAVKEAAKNYKMATKFQDETMKQMEQLMNKYFKEHPTYMYMAVFSQLLSRINHPLPSCQQALIEIISKVAIDYPHQALWMMAPIWKTDDAVQNKLGNMILVKMNELENRQSKSSIFHHYSVFNDLVDVLISICNKKIPNDKTTVPLKSISLKLKALLKTNPNQIMIPAQIYRTISLPKCKFFINAEHKKGHHPFPSKFPYFVDVHNDVQVLVSLQRPKKLVFRGSDGCQYPFMCKPMDDLRLDSRIMEFSSVVNMYLQRDPASCDRNLHIRTYSVVPINPLNGIIEWVTDLIGYRSVIIKMFKMKAYKVPNPSDVKSKVGACKTDEQKLKFFEEVLLPLHPPVLHKWFFHQFATPDSWYLARKSFVRTTAVMSIVGYVVGLGDRHGENILLDTISGEIMHVDFNCLFGRGEFFQVPEVVPFRLTQNMVKAMGLTGIEGHFIKTCEITNRVIRNHSDQLLYVLKPFLYDPKLQKKPNAEEKAKADINTISKKMSGFVLTPKRKTQALSVEGQVRCLVSEATSSKNLSQMYLGWNPYL